MQSHQLCLKDNEGTILYEDDVVYDGKDYYRIYTNDHKGEFEMMACTKGYQHSLQPKDMKALKRVGTFEDLKPLLVCD